MQAKCSKACAVPAGNPAWEPNPDRTAITIAVIGAPARVQTETSGSRDDFRSWESAHPTKIRAAKQVRMTASLSRGWSDDRGSGPEHQLVILSGETTALGAAGAILRGPDRGGWSKHCSERDSGS